jgi:hypothetical protein
MLTDELVDAEKADAETARNCRQRCQSPAYRSCSRSSSVQVETELADFLKASPVLARYLAHWQSEG